MGTMTEKSLELANFLKSQSIFQVLDMNVLEDLSLLFTEAVYGPGQVVFREGDAPDGVYVIKSGSVAVIEGKSESKVLAYLTAGECFGETAVLQDSPRGATIRVPEEALVLKLPTSAMRELTRKFPAFTSKIAEIIQSRQSGRVSFKPPGLQGNLAFFDLPTVIQTVLASRQDGVLSLISSNGREIGRVALYKSMIHSCSFSHLKGEAALYELMNSSDPFEFTFDHLEQLESEPDREFAKRPPHMLLIEGARRADELPKLIESCGWPNSIYDQIKTVPDINAFGAEKRDLLRTVWSLVEMGCNTDSICKQVSQDRYSVLTLIDEMLKANWIKKEEGPKPTDEILRRTGQFKKPSILELKKLAQNDFEDEGKFSGTYERPRELVRVINAFNGLATNLGLLYGKQEVRSALQAAVVKVSKVFPVMSGLKIHVDSPSLDMRRTNAEFSASLDAVAGILLLGNYLMSELLGSQNL